MIKLLKINFKCKLIFNRFLKQERIVQLAILTSTVKIFLMYPYEISDSITELLDLATTSCESPDVRDRAYFYWRILSIDPEKLKKFLFAKKFKILILDKISFRFNNLILKKLMILLIT